VSTEHCLTRWYNRVAKMDRPRVVELGVRGWDGKPPKHHRTDVLGVCPLAHWVGSDVLPGNSVDVVADAHNMGESFNYQSVDAMIACSVLEHLKRPWVAAKSIANVMKPGAPLFVQTHQTFPYHGYPDDYFRFSREAMRELFCEESGWRVIDCEYLFPCRVIPTTNNVLSADWNYEAEAWLNVEMLAERI
jgi:hypothetical protein